jgi:hypothetical protein
LKTQKNIGIFIEEMIDLEKISHVLSEREEAVRVKNTFRCHY